MEPTHVEKTRLCLEELERMAKSGLEQRRRLAKEALLTSQLQDQVKHLQAAAQASMGEPQSELAQILACASGLVQIKTQQHDLQMMHKRVGELEQELHTSREEAERVRERYRDAIVTSTRSNLQTSQLGEELEACKQQLAQAESKVGQESRRILLLVEERDHALRRSEQLGMQHNQLKAQVAALEMKQRAAAAAPNSSGSSSQSHHQQQPRMFGMEREFQKSNSNGPAKKRSSSTNANRPTTQTASTGAPPLQSAPKRQQPPPTKPRDEFDFL
ncbi:hypothetical protein BASA81_003062 [Batrachochytrium salamandrivorans]|nr:hypothetical protein BASA81_003062 [Batrachochytrium salamandrivorans]